jgi:hypothetical protein
MAVETPVPVSDEVCGEPDALSATLSVAVAVPADVGAKTMEMVHFAPAASELPQVVVSLKTPASAPDRVMPVIAKAALPVFMRVAVCAALLLPVATEPKVSVAGVSVAAGAVTTAVPEPLMLEVCVPTLSTTLSDAEALPAAVGLKETLMVQEAPAASELPQLFMPIEKAAAFVPVIAMDVIGRAALPALARVKVCDELALPTFTLPKLTVVGVSAACGAAIGVVAFPSQLKAVDCCGIGEGKFAPRSAERGPSAEGVQVTAIEQLAPAARLAPQLLVSLNEPGSLPKKLMLVIDNAAFPVLLRVAVWALLWLPTVTLPKARS